MIMTVAGPIKAETMGLTLSHEHIKWDYDDTVCHELYYEGNYDQKNYDETYEALLPIFKRMYKKGCRCVVDASPPIGGSNLKLFKQLSESSGVNIIGCTGWNVFRQMYKIFSECFVSQMANRLIYDFEHGMVAGIKPGYIKILCERNEKIKPFDEAMINASMIASDATGMPIHCHILEPHMVYQVIEILESNDFDMSKFLWSHADKEGDMDTISYAYNKGIWIGFDMIKMDNYKDKASLLNAAIEKGYDDKILLSHDEDFFECATKETDQDRPYVLFNEFISACEKEGIDSKTIINIMTKNPASYYKIR